MMPVIMKTFEYTLLKRVLPMLQEHGRPALAQTTYQKHVFCQDTILLRMRRYGNIFETAVTPSFPYTIWKRPTILLRIPFSFKHCIMLV